MLKTTSFTILLFYLAERDNALADLELKEIEVSRVISQIEELKSVFEKEETLRYEYEILFITSFFFLSLSRFR